MINAQALEKPPLKQLGLWISFLAEYEYENQTNLTFIFFLHLSSIFSQGVGVGTRIDLANKLTLEIFAGKFSQIFIQAQLFIILLV